MGLATDYEQASKRVSTIIEEMFYRLSEACKFREPLTDIREYRECFYYGREESQDCHQENCPLFDKQTTVERRK